MIIDGRSLPDGEALDADIVVAGAGAAGITLGLALDGSPFRVLILESGGFDPEEATQALYAGDLGAQNYGPLDATRLRYFGGSTNHWGGWCRKLDEVDFEPQPALAHSGWPFLRVEIDPFYIGARDILELGPDAFDNTPYWEVRSGAQSLPLGQGAVETRFFQFSPPTRMGARYRDALQRSRNVRVVLNVNLTDVALSEDRNAVTGFVLKRLDGASLTVQAQRYVLALGGIENARLLLNVRAAGEGGLGNASDTVGRFFMDHPILDNSATLAVFNPDAFAPFHRGGYFVGRDQIRATFMPADDLRRRDGLLGSLTTVNRLTAVWENGVRRVVSPAGVAGDGDGAALKAAALFATGATAIAEYALGCGLEPEPDPMSRVRLTDARDALGLRRVRLDWTLTPGAMRSYIRTLEYLARQLGASGAGLLRIHRETFESWPRNTSWASHHIGTTRMGADPKISVVDPDLKLHALANFYVAGSSVFPTAGASNPTLTIVAMALRLAQHLKASFA